MDHSIDGTTKLLLRLFDGREIESVIIPTRRPRHFVHLQPGGMRDELRVLRDRAKMGLERNLTTARKLSGR